MSREKETITSADVGTLKLQKPAPVKEIYCDGCAVDTDHTVALDKNKEMVFTCSKCKRTIKFPLTETPEELNDLLAKHKEHNVGKITVEMAAEVVAEDDALFRKALGL